MPAESEPLAFGLWHLTVAERTNTFAGFFHSMASPATVARSPSAFEGKFGFGGEICYAAGCFGFYAVQLRLGRRQT